MEQINLNIMPDGVMPVCHASQFDKNRTIRFNLKDNGSVYTLAGTETITCTVRKPDDTENTINVANTSSSYVDVTFGLGDTDLSGYAMCELKIVKGTQTIGSRNFLLNIEADAFDGSKFEERSASGAIASFETNYIDNLNELIVNITATQAGSGVPSPDNVREILGFDSGAIRRNNKNLISLISDTVKPNRQSSITINSISDNSINMTSGGLTYACFGRYVYLKAGKYTVSLKATASDSYNPSATIYKGSSVIVSGINNTTSKTFTVSTDDIYELRMFVTGSGDTTIRTVTYSEIQIEKGEDKTNFVAYNGNTYTFTFGQTVYGGTLNVTTGELTVTHAEVDLGDLTWNYSSGSVVFYAGMPNDSANISDEGLTNAICENYSVYSGILAQMPNNSFIANSFYLANVKRIAIKDTRFTDATAFTNAVSGIKLVYPLATPTTVQLTPTEVRTLLNCNIFADTGDVVSCKYLVEVT